MELLWERMKTVLANFANQQSTNGHHPVGVPGQLVRAPGDCRCVARRKDGQRCRGRIREGSDYCLFHDPAITPEQRRAMSVRGAENRRRLQLPKGYPRRLDSAQAVERAMHRLYAEIRTGHVDLQTGRTLLDILQHLVERHGGSTTTNRRRPQREDLGQSAPLQISFARA
jgi:hypothetical protein